MRITLKIGKFFKRNIPSPALKIFPHCYPRYTDNTLRCCGKDLYHEHKGSKVQKLNGIKSSQFGSNQNFYSAIFFIRSEFRLFAPLIFWRYRPYSHMVQILVQKFYRWPTEHSEPKSIIIIIIIL